MSDSPSGAPAEPDKQRSVPDTSRVDSDRSAPASAVADESDDAVGPKTLSESADADGKEAKTEPVAIASPDVSESAPKTEHLADSTATATADVSAPVADTAEEEAVEATAGAVPTESVAEQTAPVETATTEPADAEAAKTESGAERATPTEPATTEPSVAESVTTETSVAESVTTATSAAESVEEAAPRPKETSARKSGSLAGIAPPGEEHAPLAMQILAGIVTAVSNKEVDLTLDDGRAAVIHRENFDLAGTDPTTVLQVGDGAEGAVLSREDPQERVVLSRKWVLRDRAWKRATESIADHSSINCKITGASKKGIVVDMMGLRGFVPLNHFQMGSEIPGPDTVGQMVELRVLAADRQKDRLLLSRRSALLKEQRKRENEAFQSLKVGQTYTGVVNDLTAFGAFVTVNGVRGLLHVSEMSWDRVSSPKGLVKTGQEIQVQVIELKSKKRRVSFSIKALIPDPLALIEIGSVHSGTVKRLVDYGVFVDIGPTEGMVHLSELAEYRPSHPSEIVLRGDEVQVKVLKVNREKRRVELSMRQALYFTA